MPEHTINTLPQSFVTLLARLIRCPSVVGAEHSFFRILERELAERGAKVEWYEGLLVAHGDAPHSLMFSSHIDRHGLVCTGPNEFQYAAFVSSARSDLLGNSVSEELMKKIVDRFKDKPVFGYEPWSGAYSGKGKITDAEVCEFRNNLIFEIEGLEHLVAGTPVAFNDSLRQTDQALIGQLDNVLTAAALVYLFERGFQGTAFFTAQEESGKSWRYLLEWFRRFGGSTNHLVVVDTSPFTTFEETLQYDAVLRKRDANAPFNQALTQKLIQLCDSRGYSYIYKDEYVEQLNIERVAQGKTPHSLGSTELGRIVAGSKGMVDGTTLQIPSSGYHTMEESAPIKSVLAFLNLLEDLIQENAK